MSESDPEKFRALVAESKEIQRELDAVFPALASARRNYMRTRSEEDFEEMERVQKITSDLRHRHVALDAGMRRASDLSEEELEAIDKRGYSGDGGQTFHLKADSDSGRSRTAFR
jgi:response regulator RpfG family c-di-GMP phosphodiesterase